MSWLEWWLIERRRLEEDEMSKGEKGEKKGHEAGEAVPYKRRDRKQAGKKKAKKKGR